MRVHSRVLARGRRIGYGAAPPPEWPGGRGLAVLPEVTRYTRLFLATVLAMAWAVLASAPASAKAESEGEARRAAFIVGNSVYRSVPELDNAVNDSTAFAASLRELGFEVTELSNIDLAGFTQALDAFEKSAEGAEAVVFYFSGHAFQLEGANYLVPVDAKLRDRKTIDSETLRLDTIIGRLQRLDRQTLVFLDACRNNPLPEKVREAEGASKGLAQIETGTGTFVAFATQPGNVAYDGEGEHSAFTGALLENMDEPGISISDMMIRVRNTVATETKNFQTPWDQSSLRSQFYFNPQEEESAALTDEDRELLAALDPELRKKFESRFGIKVIDEAFADGDGDGEGQADTAEPQVPNIVVETVDVEEAEPATATDTAAGGGAESPAEEAVASLSPEAATGGGNLIIMDLSEDSAAAEEPAFLPDEPGREDASAPPVVPVEPTPEQAAVPVPDVTAPEAAVSVPTIATPKAGAPIPDLARPAEEDPESLPPVASAEAIAPAEVRPAQSADEPKAVPPPQDSEADRLSPQEAPAKAAPAVEPEIVIASGGPAEALKPAARSAERIAGTEVEVNPPPTATVAPDVVVVEQAPPALEPEIQVAAVEPTPESLLSPTPETVAPESVIPLPEVSGEEPDEDQRRETARAIQGELTRLGCYRSGIDGEWGPGSAKGLLRYFATKKEAPDDLEPSEALLARLSAEESVICQRTETAKPKKSDDRKTVKKKPAGKAPVARTSKPPRVASGGAPRNSAPKSTASGKKKITKLQGIGG